MHKIIIHKFRQISKAEIDLKDFTLFIGQQASGKSTIAKLIYFFKNVNNLLYVLLMRRTQPDKIIDELTDTINSEFIKAFSPFDKTNIFHITYQYENKCCISISFEKSEIVTTKINKSLQSKIFGLINEFLKGSNVYQYAQNADLQRSDAAYHTANKIFSQPNNFLFIPAGREITVSYSERLQQDFFAGLDYTLDDNILRLFMRHSKSLIDYYAKRNGFEVLFNEGSIYSTLRRYVESILKGRYESNNGEKIYYNDNNSVPLRNTSSGQQESIRIIQDAINILDGGNPVTRIIEEPEAHLFPSAQKSLVQLLALIFNQTHSQLIITTHSLHVLATFNNLLYYSKVLKESPDKKKQLEEYFGTIGISDIADIKPEKFAVYALNVSAADSNDYCKSLIDIETNLIGENAIDESSEKIYDDFNFMYSII